VGVRGIGRGATGRQVWSGLVSVPGLLEWLMSVETELEQVKVLSEREEELLGEGDQSVWRAVLGLECP